MNGKTEMNYRVVLKQRFRIFEKYEVQWLRVSKISWAAVFSCQFLFLCKMRREMLPEFYKLQESFTELSYACSLNFARFRKNKISQHVSL